MYIFFEVKAYFRVYHLLESRDWEKKKFHVFIIHIHRERLWLSMMMMLLQRLPLSGIMVCQIITYHNWKLSTAIIVIIVVIVTQ